MTLPKKSSSSGIAYGILTDTIYIRYVNDRIYHSIRFREWYIENSNMIPCRLPETLPEFIFLLPADAQGPSCLITKPRSNRLCFHGRDFPDTMQHTSTDTCYRIKIAGEAGDGTITAGELLMTVAARQGFDASVTKSFPSNIRGGYTQTLVTIASQPICSPIDECDILLSISCDAFLLDTRHLGKKTIILAETSILSDSNCKKRCKQLTDLGHTVMSVPLIQFARETAGNSTLRSTVALGVIGEILNFHQKHFKKALSERFESKGSEMVALNHIALESGYFWAGKHLNGAHIFHLTPPPADKRKRLILEGNQAIALGAISAGCRFFASYPITPATAIGDTLSRKLHHIGGFSYQAEDEIAALGAVIGASFNGCKAMTATSGPGLSLMQEFIGYASMVELPVVIVDVQRVGPSTGMPTKHSQDDLLAAVFGGHGEGQRIVIAPVNVEDCYHATVLAFNCSERYQCPTLLLSDSTQGLTKTVVYQDVLKNPRIVNRTIQHAKSGKRATKPPPFLRYRLGEHCINPMTIPGTAAATYRATGVEHDEDSNPINTPMMRSRQMERRARKLAAIESQIEKPVIWDEESGEAPCAIGVCAWGCTALATRHAVTTLRKEGIHICALYPRLLYPVCTEALHKWMRCCDRHIIIEANHTGQYCSLVKMSTPLRPHSLTFAHGEPITPSEIAEGIRKVLATDGDIS